MFACFVIPLNIFHLFQLALLHDTIAMSPLLFGLQLIPIAFINLMGLTSIPVIEKNISRKLWKGLHRLGAVVIWIALAKNYLLIFFIPSLLGLPVCYYFLGYGLTASLLIASMFATHTLVAYPIVSRLGIARNEAVAITVG